MSSNTHPQKNNLLTKVMKTNFTKNLKGSTRIMDLIFMLAIAIAYAFVKHIDRKNQTIIIISSEVNVTLSVERPILHTA